MAYEANWANTLGGHLDLGTGGPEKPPAGVGTATDRPAAPNNRYTDQVNIRDILNNVVSKKYTSFSDPDIKSDFKTLIGIVGQEQANKLMNQAFVYNNRGDANKYSPVERVQAFYNQSSKDPYVSSTLGTLRDFAGSTVAGFRNSPDLNSQKARGNDVLGSLADNATAGDFTIK